MVGSQVVVGVLRACGRCACRTLIVALVHKTPAPLQVQTFIRRAVSLRVLVGCRRSL